MTEKRITEAEIAAWTSESHHMPLRAGWALAADYHSRIKRLLSERREREGKLAELFYVREEHGKALLRAEAAEATLARVSELPDRWEAMGDNSYWTDTADELREALTTPVVSSDRLTPEERENVEDERAFAAKNNTVPSRSILPLIAIIDRLAPPVSPGETQ